MNMKLTFRSARKMYTLSQWKIRHIFSMAKLPLTLVKGHTFALLKPPTDKSILDEFLKTLKDKRFRATGWAYEILAKASSKLPIPQTAEEDELELVLVSSDDLDLKVSSGSDSDMDSGNMRFVTIKEIYMEAKLLGLEVCPTWVVPLLFLQCKDQLQTTFRTEDFTQLYVAVDPITSEYNNIQKRTYSVAQPAVNKLGDESLFEIRCDSSTNGDLLLDCEHVCFSYSSKLNFIFARRIKQTKTS